MVARVARDAASPCAVVAGTSSHVPQAAVAILRSGVIAHDACDDEAEGQRGGVLQSLYVVVVIVAVGSASGLAAEGEGPEMSAHVCCRTRDGVALACLFPHIRTSLSFYSLSALRVPGTRRLRVVLAGPYPNPRTLSARISLFLFADNG